MLPKNNDPAFPDALKKARENKKLTPTELARLVGISPVMPPRYEDRENAYFAIPRPRTWDKLNAVLFDVKQNNASDESRVYLDEADIEEILKELKLRGCTKINIEY